jgi:alpha-tubulin suppressor-like RCC1 family protein
LEEERILKERQAKECSDQLSKARERIAKYQRCISVYVGLKTDGTVVAAGYNNQGQCNVSGWRDIVAVATNYFCTIGLKADGTVVAAGDNEDGECNVSDWCDIGPVPEEQKKSMRWHAQGLCKYCGGELKGFFSKKCTSCGKTN